MIRRIISQFLKKDPAVMFKELDGFIQKVKEPHLHELLLSFLEIRSL